MKNNGVKSSAINHSKTTTAAKPIKPFVPESCRPEANQPPKNLKTVIEYDFKGIRNTPNTLYWGGRWPDDFFLGNRFTSEPPRKTDIADVMEWMATVDDLSIFSGADVCISGGEVPLNVLYRAASLEIRLHTPDFQPWSSCAPWFAKKS